MKLVSIIGARPQFIKAAVLSRTIAQQNKHRAPINARAITERVIHTGQHFDDNMSHVFFEELDIQKPHSNLGISGIHHGAMTGRMLEKIETDLTKERPDLLVVYGDTNSTLAGALAASKLHIPVAHIEAGLRSFNRSMPEEINRVVTDHIATLNFCPTQTAVENLKREGVEEHVYDVGDIMYDASLYYGPRAQVRSHILCDLNLKPKNYLLATVHRPENTDDTARLLSIFKGLMLASEEIPVVVPLHPRTRKALERTNASIQEYNNLRFIHPVGYHDMAMLEKNARLILTDSGGVQKEAFFYQIPCLTLRSETEWVELLEISCNALVGADTDLILEGVRKMTANITPFPAPETLYGDGKSAEKILKEICRFLKG